jgi:hypothetical protein
VLELNRWQTVVKVLVATLLIILLALSPIGNSSSMAARKDKVGRSEQSKPAAKLAGKVAETSPPIVIQELSQALEDYQPQVAILSPKSNVVLSDNTVDVRFQVKDLPIFKNEKLGLGPHLHVLLDNRTYQAVYDLNQPIVFENLEPGTHTIRAFASRPWHESFKNDGAYAQVTFHVFTRTQENQPDSVLPLLTYSRPQGSYGAEPIMLDFYLTNAPLHLVAQENAQDDISDWRIRCTINGESFVLDRWQPVYLKGFKPGKNWIQLEFLDEKGNLVNNVFNNTARVITYEPKGKDTLSQLVRGELSVAAARGIVDPNYVPEEPKPVPTPSPTPTPTPSSIETEPTPRVTPTPSPTLVVPPIRATPTPDPTPTVTPTTKAIPAPKSKVSPPSATKPKPISPVPIPVRPTPETAPDSIQEKVTPQSPTSQETPEKIEVPKPEVLEPTQPAAKTPDRASNKSPGFWERFRKPAASPRPTPSSVAPRPVTPSNPEPEGKVRKAPAPIPTPSPEPLPTKTPTSTTIPKKVVPTIQPSPNPKVESSPIPQPKFEERDRPLPAPSPTPTIVPPTQLAPNVRSTPQAGGTAPAPLPAPGKPIPVNPNPELKTPKESENKSAEPQWFDQFKSRLDQLKSNFKPAERGDRLRRPESATPTPTLPSKAIPEEDKAIVPQPEATAKPVTPPDRLSPVKPGPTASPTESQTIKTPLKTTEPAKQSAADEFYDRLLRSTSNPDMKSEE